MIIASLLLAATVAATSPVPVPIETTAREMLTNFNAEKFDDASKDFSTSMREIVTPAILASMKKQMDEQVGKFVAVSTVRQQLNDGNRTVDLIAKYEKAGVSIRVIFDADGRIGSAYFDPIKETPIDPLLEAAARELLANFVARRFDAVGKKFSPELAAQLPSWRLMSLSNDVAKRFGMFKSITEVKQGTEKALRRIEFLTQYELDVVRVWVVFDSYRRVAGLHIGPVVQQP
jgi:hypothetical protein